MRHENRCALCNAPDPKEQTLVKGLKICTKCLRAWTIDAPQPPCVGCEGKGKTDCGRCGGSGEEQCSLRHWHTCEKCRGDGTEPCYLCARIGVERPVVTRIPGACA